MRLRVRDANLLNKVQAWAPISRSLRLWKMSDYKIWSASGKLEQMKIKTEIHAWSTCKLVLNIKDESVQSAKTTTNPPSEKDLKVNESGPSTAVDKESPCCKDDNEAGPSEVKNVPVGEKRVQLLGLRAGIKVEAVNIYDSFRGHCIYRLQGDTEHEVYFFSVTPADYLLHCFSVRLRSLINASSFLMLSSICIE